jgi:hypothetical protein
MADHPKRPAGPLFDQLRGLHGLAAVLDKMSEAADDDAMERDLALLSEQVEKYTAEIEEILKRRGIDVLPEGGGNPPANKD